MDTSITFNEVVTLVANPPTLAPHPNFANLRALQCHLQRGLAAPQLPPEQHPRMGRTRYATSHVLPPHPDFVSTPCDDNRGDFVYHLVPWAFNTLGMVLHTCATYLLVIENLKGFHDSLGI
jgi:hypothetical protein